MVKLHIIGTSHIAKESYNLVKNNILKNKPDIVAVEIDKKRLQALLSKQTKIRLSDIKRYGLTAYIFARIGSWLQRKLGERAGLAPGSEIKAAIIAAKKINAKIYLIDQDIEITFKKLSKALGIKEKLKLIFILLFGFFIPTKNKTLKKIDLAKVPEQKLIEELTADFKKKFPSLYKVLVADRDKYMAKQLIFIANHHTDAKIIAVVGAGHIKGLKNILSKQNIF